jgi:RNA ligase
MEAQEITRRESVMVQLGDIMDLDLLDEMIEAGYVTAREHNTLPLIILNYTPKAQYEWVWNDVTLKARGLIFNKLTHEIVARPFEKFFNWDQGIGRETWQNPMPPSGPAIRMEKMDGSLGVLVAMNYSNGTPTRELIATRGSFHSEQAEWATEFYNNFVVEMANTLPAEKVFSPLQGKTYLFEIVYPENRIVVDYGDYRGLVLIDVIDNESGKTDLKEFDDCEWPDKVKRMHLNLGFDSGQAADIPPGDEGFVYLWPEKNYRVKMKSAEYMELHRLVSHLSEKSIWEMLMEGKTLDQMKAGLPDEFYGFVDKTYGDIMRQATEIMLTAQRDFSRIKRHFDTEDLSNIARRDVAKEIVKSEYRKYLFLLLDGKPIYPVALKDSKPSTDKALVSTEDI